jgi:hypothetical protein
MTKEEETALFQKATEAMRLFGENPDAARGFFDALKKGDFSFAGASHAWQRTLSCVRWKMLVRIDSVCYN